ncbi:MAG: ABC transporter ATP-binding protein [Lachnospiraceae bacterium]|nr:ABC transporter ATP-binding protein [Lachnospiraceae bacterium]
MIMVEHLTKCYGDFMAVNNLSFEIEEGHVYGFLGPNGAGKSTTMNIMTGCLSATEGTVRIDGYDIFEEPQMAKKLMGYLPEQPPLYLNETPEEYLKFVGAAKGLKGMELARQVEKVMDQTKIGSIRNKMICTLSKGYKQRVGIAQALLGNPKVIILDEPTAGLDPIQMIEIRDLIRRLGESRTVILSSHILSEVQAICEKVLIIAGGRLVAFDAPENLEKLMLSSNGIDFKVEALLEEAEEIMEKLAICEEYTLDEVETGLLKIHVKADMDDVRSVCRRVFFAFAEKQKAIVEMVSKKANLEEVFLELTDGAVSEEREVEKE